MEIVSKKDFEGLSNINNLSPFEMLLLVAEKASEKEKKVVNSKVEEDRIDIPMQEKRVLPFDLNSTPSTSKQQRTTPAKRRCSLINVDAYKIINVDLNSIPSTSKQQSTTPAKRRCTPIDVDAFIPCNEIINVDRPRIPSPPPPPPPPPPPQLPFVPPASPPEMFLRRIQELGGSNPEFVILKKISNTDANISESRLSMPLKQCEVHFDNWKDVPVMVIEPDLRVCTLTFTTWGKTYPNNYVLKTGWSQLLTRNPDIRPGNIMHIWRFQLPPSPNHRCGFALVNISD